MFRYTEEQKEWLLENAYGVQINELAKRFNERFNANVTAKQMDNFKANNNLTGGVRIKFTKEQDEWLKENYLNTFTTDLVEKYNERFKTNVTAKQLNSRKSYMKLKSGLVGKKLIEKRKMYSEIVRPNGYTMVKVARGENNKNWIPKQRYLYEKEYGEIPEDCCVVFANGDKTDFRKENLVLVEKKVQQLASVRRMRSKDPEITKTGLLIAELMIRTSEAEKKINRKE